MPGLGPAKMRPGAVRRQSLGRSVGAEVCGIAPDASEQGPGSRELQMGTSYLKKQQFQFPKVLK